MQSTVKTWNKVWSSPVRGSYGEQESRLDRAFDKLGTWIKSGLTFREGEHVLDAGCGDGSILLAIKRHFNVEAYGIDISDQAKKQAMQLMSEEKNKFEFQINCVSNTDYKNESFDKIFSLGVIEHFKNPEKSIKEKYRLLKKGGTLILMTPNKRSVGRWDRLLKVFFGRWPYGYQDEYSPCELEQILIINGFTVTKKKSVLREGLSKDPWTLKIVSSIDRLISIFIKDWGFYAYVYASKI